MPRVRVNEVEIAYRVRGTGDPVVLIGGFTMVKESWGLQVQGLARHFRVITLDNRGVGETKTPAGPFQVSDMAADTVGLMDALDIDAAHVFGVSMGGLISQILALDHPDRVERAAVLDVCPTLAMYERTDMAFASGYYHWFFLIQPYDLPERLIAADPDFYLESKTGGFGLDPRKDPSETFDPAALGEYKRCFRDPAVIHASCEDYRAAATIDLEHDRADLNRKIACPLLVLWGTRGLVGRQFDVLGLWRERAGDVTGRSIDCGHYLAEEAPADTLAALQAFL